MASGGGSGGCRRDIDAVYPEAMSRFNRKTILEFYPGQNFKRAQKKARNRQGCSRYRTQPVTFYEIQEVDEEQDLQETGDSGSCQVNMTVASSTCSGSTTTIRPSSSDDPTTTNKSDADLKLQLTEFSRSLPRRIAKKLESNRSSISEIDVGNNNNNSSSSGPSKVENNSADSKWQSFNIQPRPSI